MTAIRVARIAHTPHIVAATLGTIARIFKIGSRRRGSLNAWSGNAGRVTEKTKGEQSNMVDKYEKVRQEYLNICEGHNGEPCDGDPSVGIFPCPFYGYDRGCLLEGEEYKTAPFGFNRLAKEVHENAVAHGWWEEERGLPEVLMLCCGGIGGIPQRAANALLSLQRWRRVLRRRRKRTLRKPPVQSKQSRSPVFRAEQETGRRSG